MAHGHIHSLFIPYEIYILVAHPSIIKLFILVFNCAIVYYLAKHKELFGEKEILTGKLPIVIPNLGYPCEAWVGESSFSFFVIVIKTKRPWIPD